MAAEHPWRRVAIFVLLIFVSAGSLLVYSLGAAAAARSDRRRLRRQGARAAGVARFRDPKSVTPKAAPRNAPEDPAGARFAPVDRAMRARCQIVYLLGVEGATHHGFMPVLEALARNQADAKGQAYSVDASPMSLKAGLFGWFRKSKLQRWGFHNTPEVDDPDLVRAVMSASCPDDGRRHVLMEWASFPSGQEDDPRSYRVKRQRDWLTMTPEEVAESNEALQQPTNISAFYEAYSPYADIKFIVLHRPYLETIASHKDWDGGPTVHSNIIRGFMLILRRFLDTHPYDLVSGARLWSLVCVRSIMERNYESKHDLIVARKHVLAYLSKFLDWPNGDCRHCFDKWRESKKDARAVLGEKNVPIMMEHMEHMRGIWPPPGEEGIKEQQCEI